MPVLTAEGDVFALTFTKGLPPVGDGPNLYLMWDGSICEGALLVQDGQTVLRTTNSAGGRHEPFDIPASKIIGHASAGPRRGVF